METATSARGTLLRHFPREVREAYSRTLDGSDPGAIDTVVLAVLRDHIPQKAGTLGPIPSDTSVLVADLGLDSIAIAEMVFFFEDLFGVGISNGEITAVRTVGDLRVFIRGKLGHLSARTPV